MAAIGQVDRGGEGEKKVEAKQSLNAAFLKCNQELLWASLHNKKNLLIYFLDN